MHSEVIEKPLYSGVSSPLNPPSQKTKLGHPLAAREPFRKWNEVTSHRTGGEIERKSTLRSMKDGRRRDPYIQLNICPYRVRAERAQQHWTWSKLQYKSKKNSSEPENSIAVTKVSSLHFFFHKYDVIVSNVPRRRSEETLVIQRRRKPVYAASSCVWSLGCEKIRKRIGRNPGFVS